MAVPFLVVFLADHPRPTRRQGSGGGPPPQDLRTAGQPLVRFGGSSADQEPAHGVTVLPRFISCRRLGRRVPVRGESRVPINTCRSPLLARPAGPFTDPGENAPSLGPKACRSTVRMASWRQRSRTSNYCLGAPHGR